MAYSFYGGKQGPSYKIVAHYNSIKEMVDHFNQGGTYNTVGYGEYVIIDTVCNNGQYSNPENGIIYRRGLNYTEQFNPHSDIELGVYLNPNPNWEQEDEDQYLPCYTVAKEVFIKDGDNYKKIYYDQTQTSTGDESDYIFNEERFRTNFSTFVQNPGGGAQYVGQIVGPQGSSPQLSIIEWEDLIEKINNPEVGSLHKGSLSPTAHIAARFYEDYLEDYPEAVGNKRGLIEEDFYNTDGTTLITSGGIQDNLNFAYLDILDAYGNIKGAEIAFDIPAPAFYYNAVSISPYEEGYAVWRNDRWEYENLISENSKSKDHPYYWQYDIKIPEGIHGQDFTSFGINLPTEQRPVEREEDGDIINTDNNDPRLKQDEEPNHHYQFYYTLTDYATEEQGKISDRKYVPGGFLKSIYEIKGNNDDNPQLEERRSGYPYQSGTKVFVKGLPVNQVINRNNKIINITDLCLEAIVDENQPDGGLTSNNILNPHILAKLKLGQYIYDGDDNNNIANNTIWNEGETLPSSYTGVIWKVIQSPIKPLNLLKIYYTYDGHEEIAIRSIAGIAQAEDGTVYVKYSDDNSIYAIGENQSIKDIQLIQEVEIDGEKIPIYRFCIYYNTYNHDAKNNIIIDDDFIYTKTEDGNIIIEHFPTTDSEGRKIQYIDTIVRFINEIKVNPDTQEIVIQYSDKTTYSLGTHREVRKIELQNNNYIGKTQKFIAEYNTHTNENAGTEIFDKQELSDSLNTIAAIRQYEDNIIILYSDPAVRKNLDANSIVRISYDGNANTGYKINNSSYSVYDKNGLLYNGDDYPNESNTLFWYNTGHIYRGNRIYQHFESLTQFQSNSIWNTGIQDQYYKGWVVTVGDPNNSDIIKMYAYDYAKNEWYQLSEFDFSTINPEYSLIVRESQNPETKDSPVNGSMLKENGYWFMIQTRTENAETESVEELSSIDPYV